MELTTAVTGMGVWAIIVGMFIVLTFCVPFFIFKIRNQVCEMNKTIKLMVKHLERIAEGSRIVMKNEGENQNDRNHEI